MCKWAPNLMVSVQSQIVLPYYNCLSLYSDACAVVLHHPARAYLNHVSYFRMGSAHLVQLQETCWLIMNIISYNGIWKRQNINQMSRNVFIVHRIVAKTTCMFFCNFSDNSYFPRP